jgi:peptide/nickel transport system permease protein
LIFFVIPADPAQLAAGQHPTPQIIAHIRSQLHLDVPIYQQYWIFVWDIIRHGSLGNSFSTGIPVDTTLKQEVPVTASLVLGGAVFWLALSIPIGIFSALRPRSVLDRSGMVFVLVGISAPAVWIGLILAYVFGFKLGWTPIADYCNLIPTSQIGQCSGPAQWAYHLILPWMTFMLLFAALYVRLIRANVMETMSEDYVRTARAKGASERRVLVRHVMRNSLIPIATLVGLSIPGILAGALITESVFNYPGMGYLFYQSANNQDYPVLLGFTVVVAVATVVGSLIADIAYAVLDPRVRYVSA